MADDTGAEQDSAELKRTASSLYEIGLGASRRNEQDEARIFLSLAVGLFEKANDKASAAVVRSCARSVD